MLPKPFLSNTTGPVSSHSVKSVVARINNFLSNNFLINPTTPSICPKSIINTSAKSVICLGFNSYDIATHKSATLKILLPIESTVLFLIRLELY